MRERGERTDLLSREVKTFRGTDRMGKVVWDTVTSVERRTPWRWRLEDAVMVELNRDRPKQPLGPVNGSHCRTG